MLCSGSSGDTTMLKTTVVGFMGPNDWMLFAYMSLAVVCLVVALALMKWTTGPRAALSAWARHNGLELLEARRRFFWYGLFRLPRSTGQSIYRIKVRDKYGGERYGIARVGGFFGMGTHVSVVWDRQD